MLVFLSVLWTNVWVDRCLHVLQFVEQRLIGFLNACLLLLNRLKWYDSGVCELDCSSMSVSFSWLGLGLGLGLGFGLGLGVMFGCVFLLGLGLGLGVRLVSDSIGLSFALTSLFLKFGAVLWALIGLEGNMVFK